jgi:M6 family metalloprotease-like protein
MRVLRTGLLIVSALVCSLQADAARLLDARSERNVERNAEGRRASAPMTGRLELVWGDPGPSAKAAGTTATEFRVTLVADDGSRHSIDPDQALRAAEDLYALFGRRVAVSTVPAAAKRGGAGGRIVDAIVPVSDLVGSKTREFQPKIAGVTVWATLMCKFNDIATEQKAQSFFQSQYGTAVGQLDHYWQEVSYGQINLAGSAAYGWATLPQPRSYYVTKDETTNKDKADLTKLFEDCIAAHDPNVDFAANGGLQGVNMMFNGDLDGFAWGGSRCAALDGVNKCWSTTWNPPWSFNNLAPLSHEMGHAYGLPHANNSDNDSDTYDNTWDVMSDAWNNGVPNSTFGTLPKHINIYSRNRLGWVAAARKRTVTAGASARSVTLDRASLPGSANTQMLILNYPDQSSRYYTVEVRKRTGSYENRLAGDAVIIHEVQTGRASPAWSQDADTPPANRANNEGSMFKVGETWTSPDYTFRVTVNAVTTNGFVVTVRPAPRAVRAPGAATMPARTAPPRRSPPRGQPLR